MTFLVHAPAGPLRRAVQHFYCPAGPLPYRREDVLPGASIDLKINFGGPVSSRHPGTSDWSSPSCQGWGMGIWDSHHAVCWPAHADFVGVTLRPGGTLALFGIEAHELGNKVVPIDALLGSSATELRDRLAAAADPRTRFELLETLLTARLRTTLEVDRIAPALAMLRRTNGLVSIAELARVANVSHKHLIHLFRAVGGAPPKTLARLYRLQHLLATIDAGEPQSWTHIAHHFDFCDQAHFNKEFRKLTGRTPGRYLKQRRWAQAANPRHAVHRRLIPAG